MSAILSRKELIQLLVVVMIGWAAGQVFLRTAPIGRDMSGIAVVQELLRDRSSPSHEVSEPTLTLVVFTDFQCPACKLADPAMNAAVARDGHIRVVYKDWPIFGAVSEQAARVALAASRQGLYPAIHTRLMDERRPLNLQVIREAVEASGGSWSRVETDLRVHSAEINDQLSRNGATAVGIGIAGTPAFLAGPLLISGALDEPGFARAFVLGRKLKQR